MISQIKNDRKFVFSILVNKTILSIIIILKPKNIKIY